MKIEQKQSQNPIFTDLLSISSQIRKILQLRKKSKIIKCGYLIFLIGFIILYQIFYIISDCYLEVYSYYQIVVISLFFIDFYMETIYIKIINQYIDIFKWERSDNNEEKYRQLKNNKIRQIIYKLASKNNRDILPLTLVHHRKMVVGAFVLVFFTQFYFTQNYEDFSCFFDYEPIIMNIVFWIIYILIVVLRRIKYFNICCLNRSDTKLGNQLSCLNMASSQNTNLTVEQLEQEWKLRSTLEKVVYLKKQSNCSESDKAQKEINQIQQNDVIREQLNQQDDNGEVIQLSEVNNHEQKKNKCSQIITDIQSGNYDSGKNQPSQSIQDLQNQMNDKIPSQTSNLKIESNQIIIEIQESKKKTYVENQIEETQQKEDFEICQICLVELQDGEIGREMKCCKKIFHKECCLQWFNTKETCPNCRALPLITF